MADRSGTPERREVDEDVERRERMRAPGQWARAVGAGTSACLPARTAYAGAVRIKGVPHLRELMAWRGW